MSRFFNMLLVVGGVLLILGIFEGYYQGRKKLMIGSVIGLVVLIAIYSIGGAFLLYPYGD